MGMTKKKMIEIISDLQDGNKALQDVEEAPLSPVWKENISFFIQLISRIREDLAEQHPKFLVITTEIDLYSLSLDCISQETCSLETRIATCKAVAEQLSSLKETIEKSVPEDKKELVFFPYSSSMWDSMESVWRAAVDSGNFEVFVVPLPYFDRNPDRSIGKSHYDGDKFPSEVNPILWTAYSLAQRKPDVAFIHNPYDADNHITTIHPDYYSDKLKEHVGKLVYIPYFIGMNNQVGRHFCVNPGTLNADFVVVQSEEVANIYINALLQYSKLKNLGLKEEGLRRKVLGLGSPKQDKARILSKVAIDLPETWRKHIYKEDGTRKKVIFYNITVTSLLRNREKLILKIESSLGSFREEQEEIALLWRPHPLVQSTLRSRRPSLYKKFNEIIERYKAEDWGIFDESGDFSRAVAVSDGYYGDFSSVVEVFKEAGKPTMLHNMNIV